MTTPSLLSASIALSEILSANPPTSTVGNVNVIQPSNNTNNNNNDDQPSSIIPICYLPYLQPFTTGDGIPWNALGQYEGLAAIMLAMEHLNTGNGTIVPELNGIDKRCPLRFTTNSFDTELQQRVGVDHVITLTDRSGGTSSGSSAVDDDNGQQRALLHLLPTAILGAAASSISIPTSIISSLRGFPQISPISTSAALDDTSQYKLFGRTIPNDDGTAIPLLAKLTKEWNVRYVAVLHIDDAYGNAFAKGISLAAQRDAPDLKVATVDLASGADDAKISEAIQQLKETQYTFFFGIIFPDDIVDRIMTEAYNQGIAGTGRHTWLFSDSVGSTVTRRSYPVGSALERAYRGTGVLSAVGGIPGIEAYDKLTKSMQELGRNEVDREYVVAHLPKDYSDGRVVDHSDVTDTDTSFLKSPGLVAPFLYDATVALGLASCGLVEKSEMNEYFTGEELFQAFLNTTFDGTSGSIVLEDTGTRDPRSALFSLTNFIDDEDDNIGEGNVQFKGVESDLFKSGEWASLVPYTFNDGTSDIPADLPELETDSNYLSTGWKVFGGILVAIIILLALGFTCWTYANSAKRVVRSSQPIFLYMISAGTLLMGLSIIPFTIDLGVTDQAGANAACMSFPWLVAIGFSLTFSALFTKTYRINQIMQNASRFKRLKVTAMDVMKPMLVLLLLNVIVLAVWTAIDPLQRETVVYSTDPFLRNTETYGTCTSDHDYIFLAILCVINLGSLLIAVFQAYKARNVSTELHESRYIFMAMVLILLVSFIGIPIIIIARENTSAFYFVVVGIIFVVCTSILLLIFGPKVQALRSKTPTVTSSWGSRPPSTIGHSSSTTEEEGIRIVNRQQVYAQLEKENQELKQRLKKDKGSRYRRSSKGSLDSDTGYLKSSVVSDSDTKEVRFDVEEEQSANRGDIRRQSDIEDGPDSIVGAEESVNSEAEFNDFLKFLEKK